MRGWRRHSGARCEKRKKGRLNGANLFQAALLHLYDQPPRPPAPTISASTVTL
nr:MAG TPA: hypothetical protein [Caudoviricetes sp.]